MHCNAQFLQILVASIGSTHSSSVATQSTFFLGIGDLNFYSRQVVVISMVKISVQVLRIQADGVRGDRPHSYSNNRTMTKINVTGHIHGPWSIIINPIKLK